jgi:uncharacterized protein (DUF433 family)
VRNDVLDLTGRDPLFEEYPTLTRDAIRAAASYGAALASEDIEPIPQTEG